jgi:diaminopimelate dehydrogenase
MQKIRTAIVGYGNIGKYVLEALEAASDFEIAGIVEIAAIMRSIQTSQPELQKYSLAGSLAKLNNVDAAILATPSRQVESLAKEALSMGIHSVDCFDIHGKIVDLRSSLDTVAKANNAVAIIAAGWDPGSDSVVRALIEAMTPRGITYTNFGPGMSMGHTVAAKAVAGVKAALSMTIPLGTGIHRRMVYVEIEEGYDFEQVAAAIKSDDYFVNDETHVIRAECIDNLLDMGHGVNMVRKGVAGKTQNQLLAFDMRINNPALTAQMLVAAARASVKQRPGAYTLIEIPVIDMLPGEKEELIRRLV